MKKGFTLIELLVTLAIIGTLVGVGIFIYNGYLKSAKASATITQFKMVENHIKNTLALGFTKGGGSVELNGNRSIDCDAANNKSNVITMLDSFKNYYLDQSIKNPYDNSLDAIVRTGSGGDNVDGRLRLDETECPGGYSKGTMISLRAKTHKELKLSLIEPAGWCQK